MSPLYDNGIRLIILLQSFGWLELPMRFFTLLGTPDFFVFVLPLVYWCIDAGLGIRIGFILLFSSGFNEVAKLALQGPRPYWVSSQVAALSAESSFGAPSGHAQIAAGVWGLIAAAIRRPWAWILAVVIVFLIGISRIYLAVHFPHDVLLGWLLGAVTLWAFLACWQPAASWIRHRTFLQQILLALGISLGFVLIDALLTWTLNTYAVPAEWLTNARRAGQPYPNPTDMEGILTSSGALFGLAVGLAWIERRGGYKPSGPVWKRCLCFAIGLIGVLVLYLGLSYVMNSGEALTAAVFRLIRYATIGLWISAAAPLVFQKLKLTQAHKAG